MFLEGDRFFRELTKSYGIKAMPSSSDLRFIKILLNALNMPTLNKTLFTRNLTDYLLEIKKNEANKYETLIKSILI